MSKLSDRLKELRGTSSQEEMANSCGIKRNAWARYERGEVTPGADILSHICVAHACSADWLLGLTEERGGASADAAAATRRVLSPFADARVSALEKEVTRLQGMVAGLKFALDHASAPASCG